MLKKRKKVAMINKPLEKGPSSKMILNDRENKSCLLSVDARSV